MTKMTRLSCMTAALLFLITGNATAEDRAEAPQAKPDVTDNQENPPKTKPKEETTSKSSSESSATKEEPECN